MKIFCEKVRKTFKKVLQFNFGCVIIKNVNADRKIFTVAF